MTARISQYKREISVASAYLLMLLVLALIRFPGRPSFFHAQFRDTWISATPLLVAAIGMTLVIIARHIDISIGSQYSVCGVVAALLAAAKLPIGVVALGTLAAGAVMGAMNGALVAAMGLPSIVVTLATMVILRGSLLWASQGAARHPPAGFQWFGTSQRAGERLLLVIAIAVFALFAWALRWLAAGRTVYAVGSDQEAARLAGIRVKRVGFTVFVVMGALAALAALLNAVQFTIVYPNYGEGLELKVIAAVVVGGAAITGGRGTLVGTLIGVALLATVRPALVFLDAPPQWERAIQGTIILAAVASDGLRRRGR
jgi:rhamnose transport system permease protein